MRNTRVVDVIDTFRSCGIEVDVHDPWVSSEEALAEYGLRMAEKLREGSYDAMVVAVAHSVFAERGFDWVRGLGKEACVVYDAKCIFPQALVDGRL